MTQKEKLYEQVLIAENELRTLIGQEPLEIITTGSESWRFRAEARDNTVVSLKSKLESVNRSIEKAKTAKAVEDYWAIPENVEHKQALEAQLASLKDEREKLNSVYADRVKSLLRSKLSERWAITCDYPTYVSVVLTDENSKRVFGHDFKISYEKEFRGNTTQLLFNMGTMGCFDPVQSPTRTELYVTFASLVSDEALISNIKRLNEECDNKDTELFIKINRIRKELENPLAE